MHRFIAILLVLALASCTAPNSSKDALKSAGYTDIQVGGYSFWGCGQDDTFSTKFKATNPTDHTVSGVVCCGTLKGCTIRF